MSTPRLKRPGSRVSREMAGTAVDSLLKWIRAQRKQKKPAAGHDDCIYLVLTLAKPPHRLQMKPYSLTLPHPPQAPSAVSLVLDDRPNSTISLSSARDLVRTLSLPVSEILSLSYILSGILPAGELLFADRRIVPSLNRALRKFGSKNDMSKRKRSRLLELNLLDKGWPEHLRKECFSTVLRLGSGTCCVIRVGSASQARDEVVDNVLAAAEGAALSVPRKWSNVMAFHLKTSESLALPIYQKDHLLQKEVTFCDHEDGDVGEGEEGRIKTEDGKRARYKEELQGGVVKRLKRVA
ncbi:hypothetical protein HPP92_002574 [Vanilla planifolia]|uniref:Ribosomal protein L1 n=1 Tax=Vanilla planifolia TaxID=51239 RepID=A0A835SEX7_VANPL|nr:hypothetical protein HPP92_002574 [Vanilla planifolia]